MSREVDEHFHDDPIEEFSSNKFSRRFPLKAKVSALALISFTSYTLLGTTYSANIQLGSGRVEYGQGVTQATACDSSITITPYATFANASGSAADYKLTTTKVTNVDSSCYGKNLIIRAAKFSLDMSLFSHANPPKILLNYLISVMNRSRPRQDGLN